MSGLGHRLSLGPAGGATCLFEDYPHAEVSHASRLTDNSPSGSKIEAVWGHSPGDRPAAERALLRLYWVVWFCFFFLDMKSVT